MNSRRARHLSPALWTRTAFVVAVALAATIAAAIAPPADTAHTRTTLNLRWLQMLNSVQGYALSGQDPDRYRLLRTVDGGRTWRDITRGGGTIHPRSPLTINGATMLFSTMLRPGVFVVERSDDGGHSWGRSLPFKDRGEVGQPFAIDARHLYLAVNEGAAAGSQAQALFTSSDGGRRWRFVSRTSVSARPGRLPFGCDKNGFSFATRNRGFAGGNCAGGRPFFYRSDDGGRSWRWRRLAGLRLCACNVSAPHFFSARDGALFAAGFTLNGAGQPLLRVYWTHDGGLTWRVTAPAAGRTSAVTFSGARTAWIVSEPRGNLRSPYNRLLRTDDGGRHWRTLKLPFDGQAYQLDAVTAKLAYAFSNVSDTISILRTDDGGRSWQKIRVALAKS